MSYQITTSLAVNSLGKMKICGLFYRTNQTNIKEKASTAVGHFFGSFLWASKEMNTTKLNLTHGNEIEGHQVRQEQHFPKSNNTKYI